MRAVVIGLGGIGTHLAEPLCRTLVFSKSERASKRLILVDGDAYEERNRERQRFINFGNKAEAAKELLEPLFPELAIEAKARYIDQENIFLFIREQDAVFLAVDNHGTRKLVSEHAATLRDILLISGGNEIYDGNIQIYERRNGEERKPPLTWGHPEIEFPKDRNPAEIPCEELVSQGATQILAVNFMIAAMMVSAFALWLEKGEIPYHEQYFNLLTGNMRAVQTQDWTQK